MSSRYKLDCLSSGVCYACLYHTEMCLLGKDCFLNLTAPFFMAASLVKSAMVKSMSDDSGGALISS